MQIRTLAALCAFSTLACLPHVRLPRAPRRNAPFAQRAAAWERLRPAGLGYTLVVSGRGGAVYSGGAFVQRELDHLVLTNGIEIRAPEDLLPALDTNSESARSASRAYTLRLLRNATEFGGALVAVGAALSLVILPIVSDDSGATSTNTDIALATCGVGVGIALIGALMIRPFSRSEERDAFSSYWEGLRDRLGVCQCIGVLCDCDAAEAAPRAESAGR